MGYQTPSLLSHANILRVALKAMRNPLQCPQRKDTEIVLLEIKSPSILGQGEVGKGVRPPQGWGPTPPPEHHVLDKILERTELGSSPPGNFYLLHFSLGSKSFFLCPETYLKRSSVFQRDK